MVTSEGMPDFIKSIRNFMFNYECEIQDSLGSFPPPPPPIPLDRMPEAEKSQPKQGTKPVPPHASKGRSHDNAQRHRQPTTLESATNSGRPPQAGDAFTFSYDVDAPLLHTLQIVDYFLKIMPEVCSPAFVYLTDGVMRSNFSMSKAQSAISSLNRRNTQCTLIQVGSCDGFTPETTLGFVADNELLLYLAASLNGHFIYASDCPDTVVPRRANFYHQAMLIRETRLARTMVRNRFDHFLFGSRRPGDMPRERLSSKKDGGPQEALASDSGFPWCADCRPPPVDTVTARYSDYNIPVSMNVLIEARMNEGFVVRNIQIAKLERDCVAERVNVKMELVWHPNITVVYRITNTHSVGQLKPKPSELAHKRSDHSALRNSSNGNSDNDDDSVVVVGDRGQRSPNMVDIVIRSYKMFTMAFLNHGQNGGRKDEIFAKAAMLHTFLKSIIDKDERLRQMYSPPPNAAAVQLRVQPLVFVTPTAASASTPPWVTDEAFPLASRVCTDEVDPSVFLAYTDWTAHHYHLFGLMRQINKNGGTFGPLASFNHVASMFIDSGLILNFVDGMSFAETARAGRNIMSDFRAHVCQSGTWALLKDEKYSVVFLRDSFRLSQHVPVFIITRWEMATNWILRVAFNLYNGSVDARKIVMDCLPTFSDSFRPNYRDPNRDSVARATRPLHLLPVDLDFSHSVSSNMLSMRDIGDLHTYVVEWRWSYLAREGKRQDLSGEGYDSDIVRQALHRLALTLGINRLRQDFTLVNAKGESTGLMTGPDASKYDSCLTFYHEREGYEGEELLLACQYQIVVDMSQSSVTARTWVEPWSARVIRMLFEDDFRVLTPLVTFQQILQPERCFQLKVPNIAEFHSTRMNLFSIMAVVQSSRIAVRMLQLPDITPAHAVWNQPGGADSINVDDPTYQITPERNPDEDLEVLVLDEAENVIDRIPGAEYYKTHDREETRQMVFAKKLRIRHIGTKRGDRHAILLERFMLTLFEKNHEGKFDPHIEKYRINEYNPFTLAMINPGHSRKLFFSKLAAKWMSTGEFTMVAHRCFLEFALFKRCDAISVNAERFNKLRFADNIVSELTEQSPGVRLATGVPNALDDHLYLDKWYVIRLQNNSSFLMVILPNVPLAAPNRHFLEAAKSEKSDQAQGQMGQRSSASAGGGSSKHRRQGSEPASAPVFTPALERSIKGYLPSGVDMACPTSINAYTLVMECSMDSDEMHRHVPSVDGRSQTTTKSKLNLRPLDVPCRDTKVLGEAFQGFVGQSDVPIPFTKYALDEIKELERMYSETYLQTIYLALLLNRGVAPADLVACLQSTLWKKRSIDVDITAFLHSQDVARINRDTQWQAQDQNGLQDKFSELLADSFNPLAFDVNPSQGRYYYCKAAPDKRSELEVCLQLAQNPLFISFRCSIEVYTGDNGHMKRLYMPVDKLPTSLEKLCEQAAIPWRPPTDHFVPLANVRVILHINCLYLPDGSIISQSGAPSEADTSDSEQSTVLQIKPDKQELESLATRPFQKTMSLASLITNEFDPLALCDKEAILRSPDSLPSAVIAKQHTDAQMATLEGLPHDQLELVCHCHRMFVRFIAQETLHALRDIKPVTLPLLSQVWHTIATTVDDDAPLDRYAFSQIKVDLGFLISTADEAKRRHAISLVVSELLKLGGSSADNPLGKLYELGGMVYMRDVRSRSERSDSRARWRARALSNTQSKAETGGGSARDGRTGMGAQVKKSSMADLADATPSWFLIKPTASLDGVRVLTHNYSTVSDEAANNVLAATRQLLMVALKAANTRLLLEEMADTHRFPDLLVPPDDNSFGLVHNGSAARLGLHADAQAARDELLSITHSHGGHKLSASPSLLSLNAADKAHHQAASRDAPTPVVPESPTAASAGLESGEGAEAPLATSQLQQDGELGPAGSSRNIASLLRSFMPSNREFHSCEVQFAHKFPLHPRISPRKTRQAVLASGMMNNLLVNQPNMFFVRDGDSIFYATLSDDRLPYVNQFGPTGPAGPRQLDSLASTPTPAADVTSPLYCEDAMLPGAHTIATTSPDPTIYSSFVDASRVSLTSALSLSAVAAVRADAASRHAALVVTANTNAQLQTAAQLGFSSRRRSPLVPALSTSNLSIAPTTGAGADSQTEAPMASPRMLRSESFFRGTSRYSTAEPSSPHHLPSTPESPLGRNLVSPLASHEGLRLTTSASMRTFDADGRPNSPHRQTHTPALFAHVSGPKSPFVGRDSVGRDVHVAIDAGTAARTATPTAEGPSLHQFRTQHAASTSHVPALDHLDLGDAVSVINSDKWNIPCIVLRVFGLNKPRKDMTQRLVRHISEIITVHATMPEMSDMLFRRVALNDHDMNFLFPRCNPEPTIVYLPLPQFVHDLDRLMVHFSQAFGEIIVPFSTSDLLAKAMRRSFGHLQTEHDAAADEDDSSVTIGSRVPSALRADLGRILEGWGHDRETPRRVPVDRLTFLYNFYTKADGPPREMTEIGTGIAVIAALPLNNNRTVSSGIWESLSAPRSTTGPAWFKPPLSSSRHASNAHTTLEDSETAAASDVARRPIGLNSRSRAGSYTGGGAGETDRESAVAANDASQSVANGARHLAPVLDQIVESLSPSLLLPHLQTTLVSAATSEADVDVPLSSNCSSPASTESSSEDSGSSSNAQPIPVSEIANLFNEYQRQFKAARGHMKLTAEEFDDLEGTMDKQVAEFKGQPVIAISMWSHANVRLDRLSAYVSGVYWNALGDYVSEQVLYPILATGWGNHPSPMIRLPDPAVSVDSCYGYYGNSSTRVRSAEVTVKLHSGVSGGNAASQSHLALLRAREIHLPKVPSTFTENTKKQVHAMEIARQMAQYWGSQDEVKSMRHHRQKLPRVTGISHWFSEELRGVLETICPAMHPELFRLLENPLVLDGTSHSVGQSPKPLFPAHSLRKAGPRDYTSVVYDVSALPKALKGTRQSFCIMCTLPLDGPSVPAGPTAHPSGALLARGDKSHATQGLSSAPGTMQRRRLDMLKRSTGDQALPRASARSSANSSAAHIQGQVYGLGLQGWSQSELQQQSPQPQQHPGYGAQRRAYHRVGDTAQLGRRPYHMYDIAGRSSASAAPKKMPPPSDYKPIADPETPVLNVDEITHYASHSKATRAASTAWLVVWLVGGELEMVGYNVSERLWSCVCDQIKQRLERESRRKQLLGMFASHMGGIFPGYDRQARHQGITSTWLDRNVTRDLINKYALLQQLTVDDQIHYFNIERIISPDYARLLGLHEGSKDLEDIIANPPVAGMTMNDMKTEVVLRQLQPEHLRWTRKLTFVDYTQPYVDTNHPDTLFRIGSRFMRAYQGRIAQVLRYDEIMKIAERWRQLVAVNGLNEAIGRPARIAMFGAHASDTQTSSLGEHRIVSRNTSTLSASVSAAAAFASGLASTSVAPISIDESRIQAPARGDHSALVCGSHTRRPNAPTDASKSVADAATATAAATAADASEDDGANEISLDDIKKLVENARLLHFVCAPLPLASSIRPVAADLRGFSRLFRVVSAMLQNLADSYIDYLCSTGYVVARRYEKVQPWREALASLGYSPGKVAQLTLAFVGQPRRRYSAAGQLQPSNAEAALPGIQTPCAYLIANTDRTNLLTDIEVSPQMLSIHMHALSRFSHEWRSAVPGYLKSSIRPQSIKHFTFELSKYKKLLHAKSFVYDFQLRYVASLLKPLEPAPKQSSNLPSSRGVLDNQTAAFAASLDPRTDALAHDSRLVCVVYSSDSDADDADSLSDSASSSDVDIANCPQLPGASRVHGSRRNVAQMLHVHIDLVAFFGDLSEQRYFSTRFSSRRLVRTKTPLKHREIYEYFLGHSEQYHFSTDGCRPLKGASPSNPPDDKALLAGMCSELATHSGCYRLYEGVLADMAQTQSGGFFEGTEMVSQPGSLTWPPAAAAWPMAMSSGIKVASSAPEPASIMAAQQSSGSAGAATPLPQGQHGYPPIPSCKSKGGHVYSSNMPFVPRYHRNPEPRATSSSGKQMASSYAPATQWRDNALPATARNAENALGMFGGSSKRHSTQFGPSGAHLPVFHHDRARLPGIPAMSMPPSSPPRANSIGSQHALKSPHASHGAQPASASGHPSCVAQSLGYALNEYSACKIYLASNESSVRVSLMALAPDCDSCRAETNLEALKSKERQLSHAPKSADNTNGDRPVGRRRHHHHHHHHRHNQSRHDVEDGAQVSAVPAEQATARHRRHRHRRKGRGNDASSAVDDIEALFGNPERKSMHGTKREYRSKLLHNALSAPVPAAAAAVATATDIAGPRKSTKGSRRHPLYNRSSSGNDCYTPLQRWMASLASSYISDLQADGLQPPTGGTADPSSVHDNTAQLSYYLIIDMDPQTTIGLSNLQGDGMRSRNGSLGPVSGSAGHAADSFMADAALPIGRQCEGCQTLSLRSGIPKVCGIHKVLSAVQVDMRDWENKGDVWANEPTMVMEVSEIDPDEYDKEDPDIVKWIQETARRVIRHAIVDYHRDFNWYLICQRLRMADLPRGLMPSEICDLVAFIERLNWVDVGATDKAVEQLLALNISAQRVIQALQLRMRRLYRESAQLMTSLHVANTHACSGVLQADCGEQQQRLGPNCTLQASAQHELRGSALSAANANTAIDGEMPVALSRCSTADPLMASAQAGARRAPDSSSKHDIPASCLDRVCSPVATIDGHGRVVHEQSSSTIDNVLRLLLPLTSRSSHKVLLDPSFQKTFSRLVQLNVIESPWLCQKHNRVVTVPACQWTFGSAAPAEYAATTANSAGDSVHVAGQRAQSMQDELGDGSDQAPVHSAAAQRMAESLQHGSPAAPADMSAANSASLLGSPHLPAATHLFARARVETMPGTLLVVDPDDSEYVARLFVLNPFAHHGMLELLFVRSDDGNDAVLSKIRAVARLRQRDGLHEFERKHVNFVLSTISAVVWDMATEAS
ncbi:hypothetical protein H4R26_000003 [Coemansia thaxteri]|uniref:Uncharacterized protein n=1 Tax=Coemansia thaxteri TaxID=2663907 RepID=A0A9W8BHN0_9FUNG|nr:hypothetical protein H4R26_000003 [Coemansia thaxteri]